MRDQEQIPEPAEVGWLNESNEVGADPLSSCPMGPVVSQSKGLHSVGEGGVWNEPKG